MTETPEQTRGADIGPSASSRSKRQRYTLIEQALIGVCLTMFLAMIVATLGQVLFRYVLEVSVSWTEEAARALFVLSMVMSMAFAYREKEHIVVDFLFARLPPGAQCWLGLVFNFLILAFLAFWARGALRLAELNWGSSLITVPWFRVAYFYVWELAAIALMFLYVLDETRARLRDAGNKTDGNAVG